jgi:transposase
MVAAIGKGAVFSKGRDFGAWLGLVPQQISTGDRTILGKISRRGNRYLRVLFVQAAWVVLIRPKSWERYGLKPWIEAAKKRLHRNVLANRGHPGAKMGICVDTAAAGVHL